MTTIADKDDKDIDAILRRISGFSDAQRLQFCYQALAGYSKIKIYGGEKSYPVPAARCDFDLIIEGLEQRDIKPPTFEQVAWRIFFSPLDPFLLDDNLNFWMPGRIWRNVIPALWYLFISEMPTIDLRKFISQAEQLIDEGRFDQVVSDAVDLRKSCIPQLDDLCASARSSHNKKQAIIATLENNNGVELLTGTLTIFRHEQELNRILDEIASCPGNKIADDSPYGLLLIKTADKQPEIFTLVLSILMWRVDNIKDLVAFAWGQMTPEEPSRMLMQPWGQSVGYGIIELERIAKKIVKSESYHDFADHIIPSLLKFHDIERTISAIVSLPRDTGLFQILIVQKQLISEVIERLTREAEGLIYRCLRRGAKMEKTSDGSQVPIYLEEAVQSLKLVVAANRVKDSLAISANISILVSKTHRSAETMCIAAVEVARASTPGGVSNPSDDGKAYAQGLAAIEIAHARLGEQMAQVLSESLLSGVREVSAG